jgi:glucokinase
MRILAGDVGGTKTSLAMFDIGRRGRSLLRSERYPSGAYPGLEEIVEIFLRGEAAPAAAGFGVAGPVRDGAAKITNLPWRIEESRLARAMGIRRVVLLNDFVSNARGLPFLSSRQLATLARGRAEPQGPIGILGAGTGLGQACLVPSVSHGSASRTRVDHYEVVPSESGHADLAARDPLEDRLMAFLRRQRGRATREMVLSGRGLVHLYEFFKAERAAPESRAVEAEFEKAGDRAAVISRFGLSRRDALCRHALDLFVSIYGSEAGNCALEYRATGGVYLAGGIAPKILPALRRPAFLRSFRDKPPMDGLLSAIPVRVVLEPGLGLIGAADAAYRTTMETTRSS